MHRLRNCSLCCFSPQLCQRHFFLAWNVGARGQLYLSKAHSKGSGNLGTASYQPQSHRNNTRLETTHRLQGRGDKAVNSKAQLQIWLKKQSWPPSFPISPLILCVIHGQLKVMEPSARPFWFFSECVMEGWVSPWPAGAA